MSDFVWNYFIDIKVSGTETERVQVGKELTVGSGEQADHIIEGQDLPPLAIKLSLQDDVLTLTCLDEAKNWSLAGQQLEKDKTHILNTADIISLGKIQIEISRERAPNDATETVTIAQGSPEANEIKLEEETPKENEIKLEEETPKENKIKLQKAAPKEQTQEERTQANINTDSKIRSTPVRKPLPIAAKANDEIPQGKIPGPLVRFLALMMSLTMVFFISNHLLPAIGMSESLDQFINETGTNFIQKEIKKIAANTTLPDHLESSTLEYLQKNVNVIRFILVYPLFDLLCHLIFGTSLALFLFGVSAQGSSLGKRIRGAFRSIIGSCTAPFIIYDLPVLFGRRSLKEFLTGTRLYYKSRIWATVVCLLVLGSPIAAVTLFDISLPPVVENLLVSPSFKHEKVPSLDPKESLNELYTSRAFPIKRIRPLSLTMITIPSFFFQKNTVIPMLTLYHKVGKHYLSVSMNAEIDLRPYLNLAKPSEVVKDALSIHWSNLPRLLMQYQRSFPQLWSLRKKFIPI